MMASNACVPHERQQSGNFQHKLLRDTVPPNSQHFRFRFRVLGFALTLDTVSQSRSAAIGCGACWSDSGGPSVGDTFEGGGSNDPAAAFGAGSGAWRLPPVAPGAPAGGAIGGGVVGGGSCSTAPGVGRRHRTRSFTVGCSGDESRLIRKRCFDEQVLHSSTISREQLE